MSEELVSQVALELVPGIGSKGIRQLIGYCGSSSGVFRTPKSRLMKIPGIGEKTANTILSSDPFKEAEQIIASSQAIKAEILHFTNKKYPERLKQVHDSPNIIYVKGKGELNPQRAVAVVGTRSATNYGKSITDRIIAELALLDVTVISGLAYGIDIQAHKSCLKHAIPTFGVLAGGLDRIYPSLHKKYAEEMLETGGLISESIPGTRPDAHLFPARNRIIAGMSDAVIIVEAAEKGGALITANLADSYDRVVFAVPGDVGSTYSIGTNRLIASQKAIIYTGVQDLLHHLGWETDSSVSAKPAELPVLSDEEEQLYLLLSESKQPMEIDTIAWRSQFSISQVASILLELEFKNLVKPLPGKKYELIR